MYVDFFLNQRDKNEKIGFGELPQDIIWPEGVYAGLEGEFEETVNKRTVFKRERKNLVAEKKGVFLLFMQRMSHRGRAHGHSLTVDGEENFFGLFLGFFSGFVYNRRKDNGHRRKPSPQIGVRNDTVFPRRH